MRQSAALAAITGVPIQVNDIRAGRAKPGLAAQHLAGLQLIERMSGGKLEGGAVKSTSIRLSPGRLVCGAYEGDTKTAGSSTLMVQAALPCLLFATSGSPAEPPSNAGSSCTSHLHVKGGTDADFAPPAGYLQHVLAPLLRRLLKLDIQVDLVRRGFFPRGGGSVRVTVPALTPGTALPPFDLTQRGALRRFVVMAYAAGNMPVKSAEAQSAAAEQDLRAAIGPDVPIEAHAVREAAESAEGSGSGVLLVAETDTGAAEEQQARLKSGLSADTDRTISS